MAGLQSVNNFDGPKNSMQLKSHLLASASTDKLVYLKTANIRLNTDSLLRDNFAVPFAGSISQRNSALFRYFSSFQWSSTARQVDGIPSSGWTTVHQVDTRQREFAHPHKFVVHRLSFVLLVYRLLKQRHFILALGPFTYGLLSMVPLVNRTAFYPSALTSFPKPIDFFSSGGEPVPRISTNQAGKITGR